MSYLPGGAQTNRTSIFNGASRSILPTSTRTPKVCRRVFEACPSDIAQQVRFRFDGKKHASPPA